MFEPASDKLYPYNFLDGLPRTSLDLGAALKPHARTALSGGLQQLSPCDDTAVVRSWRALGQASKLCRSASSSSHPGHPPPTKHHPAASPTSLSACVTEHHRWSQSPNHTRRHAVPSLCLPRATLLVRLICTVTIYISPAHCVLDRSQRRRRLRTNPPSSPSRLLARQCHGLQRIHPRDRRSGGSLALGQLSHLLAQEEPASVYQPFARELLVHVSLLVARLHRPGQSSSRLRRFPTARHSHDCIRD